MPRASRPVGAPTPAKVAEPVAPSPEPAPDTQRPKPGVLGFAGGSVPVGEVIAPAPVSVEHSMHQVIEPGWVPPEMRANADYQAKQNADLEAAERDLAKDRPKDNSWDGGPRGVLIIGASPNMAKDQKAHVLF